jgi:uncharacterized protein
MRSRKLDGETHLLVLDKGDEVSETLTGFASANNIASAAFQAIGAFREVTFAYWNADTREYEHIGLDEQVEVISLLGNIARGQKGEAKIHAHIAIGRRDGRVLGGHLVTGRVFPTLEVLLTVFDFTLKRRLDSDTGLHLLVLEP